MTGPIAWIMRINKRRNEIATTVANLPEVIERNSLDAQEYAIVRGLAKKLVVIDTPNGGGDALTEEQWAALPPGIQQRYHNLAWYAYFWLAGQGER